MIHRYTVFIAHCTHRSEVYTLTLAVHARAPRVNCYSHIPVAMSAILIVSRASHRLHLYRRVRTHNTSSKFSLAFSCLRERRRCFNRMCACGVHVYVSVGGVKHYAYITVWLYYILHSNSSYRLHRVRELQYQIPENCPSRSFLYHGLKTRISDCEKIVKSPSGIIIHAW